MGARNRVSHAKKNCIMVDGVPWEGRVVILGPNRQITAISSLSGVSGVHAPLVLVAPGTYSANYWYFCSGHAHIRGMGATPGEVVFTCGDNGMQVDPNYGTMGTPDYTPIIENVNFQGYARPMMLMRGCKLDFNRCSIWHNAYPSCGCIAGQWSSNPSTNGKCTFTHCYISNGGSYMFSDMNLANVYLDKCELNASPNYYSCSNSLALASYVTSPSPGFGHRYGNFRITNVPVL